jgi:7-cyano-7-deazaguanine synthase
MNTLQYPKNKKSFLHIYSGGMDSTVLLHAYKEYIAKCVVFAYGSKQQTQEQIAVAWQCDSLHIPYTIIDLPFVGQHFQSSLLAQGPEVPTGAYTKENMSSTVVPFRNGIFYSVSTGLAQSWGLEGIFLGNHQGDHFIYPDCRPEFTDTMAQAIFLGTENAVVLQSPFCYWDKKKIAQLGKQLQINFSKTYSCYNGDIQHCGLCGACQERKQALTGFDTTQYKQ